MVKGKKIFQDFFYLLFRSKINCAKYGYGYNIEHEKLEWMKDLPKPSAQRTIDDTVRIFRSYQILSRSTILQQRVIALQTLSNYNRLILVSMIMIFNCH